MPSFKAGDIVRVPFPYVETATQKFRPALVVATLAPHQLLWVVMITSASNSKWPDDFAIAASRKSGLPKASLIRPAKIAVIAQSAAEVIGTCPAATFKSVQAKISAFLNQA
jgi:mRNA interferase MazF